MCMAFVAGSGFCFAAATDCVGLAKVGLCLLSATLGIIAINVSYVIGHDDGQVPQ